MKTCSKCGDDKDYSEFNKRSGVKSGMCSHCKICKKETRKNNRKQTSKNKKEYYRNNKDQILSKAKQNYKKNKTKISSTAKKYREENKEKLAEKSRIYRQNNREELAKRSRIYRKLNKDKVSETDRKKGKKNRAQKKDYNLKYYQNNKDRIASNVRKYERIRFLNDPLYRLTKNIKRRILLVLNGKNKSASTLKLLDCTIQELKEYLEQQFTEGMSWKNHGVHGWHIDHIRPCASFELTDPEQQRECFHWSNLHPLWAKDNRVKGSFYKGKKYKLGGAV